MNVHGLKHPINLLLVFGKQCKVSFCCRRQRLDHVLQRVAVGSVEQIKQLRRNLGIGQEERIDVPLRQI